MSEKYALAVDIAMLVISSLLVINSAFNEKVYDAGATFKKGADGKLRKSAGMLGMTAESVNRFNMLVSILGAAAVGAYGLALVSKKTGAGKAPGIYTAVFGFAVSVALILSGVITSGIHKEVATFKDAKYAKHAKGYKDTSYFMITVGSVALVLITILVAKKKRSIRFPTFTGGNTGVSTFFTYK